MSAESNTGGAFVPPPPKKNLKSVINCNYNTDDASILSVPFHVLHKKTCKSVPSLVTDLSTTRKDVVFLALTS